MNIIKSEDKLLPTQKYFSYLFEEPSKYLFAINNLLNIYNHQYGYSKFKLHSPSNVTIEEMSTPPVQLSLMCFLIHITRSKKILEIGTFIGNTTMHLSDAAGEGSIVTTIEYGKDFFEIAKNNFIQNNYLKKIRPLHGDAGIILKNLEGEKFDLIFVDGSKENYLDFSLKSEKLLSENGLIIVDDAFFHGDALNISPSTSKGIGCKKLLEHYAERHDMCVSVLPIFNGILLVAKK